MSLRLVPDQQHQSSSVQATRYAPQAPSAPGLPDILRSGEGPMSVSSKINNKHPLEARIQNWDTNERANQLEHYRRIFGAADPIRREMELSIVQSSDEFRPSLLGPSANVHRDILLGKDTTIDWEDIYTGFDNKPSLDFHSEMEKKMGI
ncbi:unnamed protein product [Ambrosiozyma monospora]|uniref:Unnamed protein product n=1 Tax=Ambrosiozyma monospora TaxID=43982 RepID=A0ACB5T2A8_AMBMO|nr:unnamed protein product [Ambrosiozyma monospora]